MNIAARIVPIFTLPKISDVKSPQMIKDNTTIDVSKHTLTLENRLLYARDTASTTPSPGSGAMFAKFKAIMVFTAKAVNTQTCALNLYLQLDKNFFILVRFPSLPTSNTKPIKRPDLSGTI